MTRTAALLLLLAAQVHGQTPEPWLQGLAGTYRQIDADCLGGNLALGLGGGQWLGEHWGWEADALATSLKVKSLGGKYGEDHLQASALYRPVPDFGAWRPYAGLGLGLARLDSPISLASTAATKATLHLGAGVQRFFAERGLASVEVRGVAIQGNAGRKEVQLLAGLGWHWGSPAAPAPTQSMVSPVLDPPIPEPASRPAVPLPMPAILAPVPTAPAIAALPPRKIILDAAVLHFANGKADLDAEAVAAITKVAGSLKAWSGKLSLRVTGFTSSLGSAAVNKDLSRRRAEAVMKVLVDAGLAPASIKARGRGPEDPIATNATPEGQAANRRVEIDVDVPDAHVEVRKTHTKLVGAGKH